MERTLRQSFLISADMAHALHPNYTDKHDSLMAPAFQGGLVLKHNNNQRYATNAISAALFRWVRGAGTGWARRPPKARCMHACRKAGRREGGRQSCARACAPRMQLSGCTLCLCLPGAPQHSVFATEHRCAVVWCAVLSCAVLGVCPAGRWAGVLACLCRSLLCATTCLVAALLVPSWHTTLAAGRWMWACRSSACTASVRWLGWTMCCMATGTSRSSSGGLSGLRPEITRRVRLECMRRVFLLPGVATVWCGCTHAHTAACGQVWICWQRLRATDPEPWHCECVWTHQVEAG